MRRAGSLQRIIVLALGAMYTGGARTLGMSHTQK